MLTARRYVIVRCYPAQHPGRILIPRTSGARKLSRCKALLRQGFGVQGRVWHVFFQSWYRNFNCKQMCALSAVASAKAGCHAVVQSCSLAVEKLIQCLDRMTLRLQDRKTKSRECGFLCCPVPSSPRLRRTKQVSLLRPEFSGLRWVNFSTYRAKQKCRLKNRHRGCPVRSRT